MKRFIDHPSHSDAVEMGSVRAFACCVPRPYVISVAAGILPAVVPGILPCENEAGFGKSLALCRLRSGGKMPPSTAAWMAAATHLLPTVNTCPRLRGTREGRPCG